MRCTVILLTVLEIRWNCAFDEIPPVRWKSHSMKKPFDEKPLWWKAALMKSHFDEKLLRWKAASMKSHLTVDEKLPYKLQIVIHKVWNWKIIKNCKLFGFVCESGEIRMFDLVIFIYTQCLVLLSDKKT